MNFKEINDNRRLASSASKMDNILNRGFSEKAKKTVTNYSIAGGVAFAFPLAGFDNIIYAVILWSMYVQLCKLAKQNFGTNMAKSFVGAFIVNLIVASMIECVVSFIPVAGFIMAFVVGYFSIKLSGAAYLKALEYLHRGNVSERYNVSNIYSDNERILDSNSNEVKNQVLPPLPPDYNSTTNN